MGFSLRTIRDNQIKVFSVRKILELMGENINDEILIDGKSYRISSFLSLDDGSGSGQTTVCQILELLIIKDNQFQFPISDSIGNSTNTQLFVNGVLYSSGINKSYHISKGNLIWHGGFDLEASDEIILKYRSII